ncbi:MAG: hypothetical protein Q9160_009126 [Pyrenula sp. 1 TL-2023]
MIYPWRKTNNLGADRSSSAKLLGEDAGDSELQQYRQPALSSRTRHLKRILIDLSIIALILLIAFSYSSITRKYASHTEPNLDWIPCGNTSAEAKAAGCHYEGMQRSWIPDACYTPEADNEWDPWDDREWFYDDRLTQKLDDEGMDMLRNGGDLNAWTKFFHDEHCAYCYRKLAIAVERRMPMIDSKTANFHHSVHCANLLVERVFDLGAKNFEKYKYKVAYSPIMFQTCVPLKWA